MICRFYDPWRDNSTLLTIEECVFFIPQSGRCDCEDCDYYNHDCPIEGYPKLRGWEKI